ncbi:MAG: efflux transporter outer membrane subunit [Rhodomicrobium sp.]
MAIHRRFLLACSAAAALCGCSVGPDYQPPEVALPSLFGATSREIVSEETAPQSESIRWWQTLQDPELNRLVEQAIACNPDLEIALTRVQEVRTQQIVVISNALPNAEASAAEAVGTGNDLSKGRASPALRSATNNTSLSAINKLGGFDVAWEIDFWGKYRRQLEAVRDDAQALAQVRNGAVIRVISDVARSYINLRGLQLRLQITRNNVKVAQKTAELAQARFDRGLTNELDVTLAKRELASIQAQVPLFQAAIADAESQLALLVGTFSPDIMPGLRGFRGLPHVPSKLRPGVPADLLRRRPDIQEAERELAGATARIGVATALLFPSIALIGAEGLQGGEISPTATVKSLEKSPPYSNIWSFGPGAYWPVLDFGRLDAQIDVQELAAHEQLVNYKKTILVAVEEVDDAIKQYRAQQQRLRELTVALEQGRRAVTLASERYERGITDFLNLLDAQRQEYALEDQAAVAKQAVIIQYIALYKALGGGWELYDALPPFKGAMPAVAATVRRVLNNWQ